VVIGEPTLTDLHQELTDEQSIIPVVLLDLALDAVEGSWLSHSLIHGVHIEASNRVLDALS